jgi:hypothetical protein
MHESRTARMPRSGSSRSCHPHPRPGRWTPTLPRRPEPEVPCLPPQPQPPLPPPPSPGPWKVPAAAPLRRSVARRRRRWRPRPPPQGLSRSPFPTSRRLGRCRTAAGTPVHTWASYEGRPQRVWARAQYGCRATIPRAPPAKPCCRSAAQAKEHKPRPLNPQKTKEKSACTQQYCDLKCH